MQLSWQLISITCPINDTRYGVLAVKAGKETNTHKSIETCLHLAETPNFGVNRNINDDEDFHII